MAWNQHPANIPQAPKVMYEELGAQPGMQRPPSNTAPNPFNDAFYGAGSGFIRGGLGAYGERILGTGTEYVQSNTSQFDSIDGGLQSGLWTISFFNFRLTKFLLISQGDGFYGQVSKYFSDPQYYFQVNNQYVKNKLKVILFPFLHRGHWTRIAEQIPGGLTHKPPIYDINAPDLYIPFMAFGTYIVLCGLTIGLLGKFSPEAMSIQFSKGLLGWLAQLFLLRLSLYALGGGEAPILDLVAYGGYAFVGIALSVLARILWSYSYYVVILWTCLCMGIFLVKTMKRILFAEARSYDRDSSRHHYLLLFMAVAQFPLFLWLGYIIA